MAVIGITGSIASGKSTLRDILAALLPGEVFDADLAARDFLDHDPEVFRQVKAEVSEAAYREDGSADRQEIRRIVYSNPAAKSRLEAILHPLVRKAWTAAAARARAERRHLIVDIPLLFETNAAGEFDFVVTVACSPEVQNARLAARGISPELSERILSSQMPAAEKILRSTQVIWNDGCLAALEAQASELASLVSKSLP
ncbi:MAG: dephospho-CoA kinase [Verrucomicrobiae bacterium]